MPSGYQQKNNRNQPRRSEPHPRAEPHNDNRQQTGGRSEGGGNDPSDRYYGSYNPNDYARSRGASGHEQGREATERGPWRTPEGRGYREQGYQQRGGQPDPYASHMRPGNDEGHGLGQQGPDQHGEGIGQQLQEAGQRLVGKVKRMVRNPKNYTRSDERIREDVCDKLSLSDEVDPSDMEVTVNGGEVTLTGTIQHRHMKFVAEEIADDVPGVHDVHNQLKVKRPS